MPNTHVQVTAEGMPPINRRKALAAGPGLAATLSAMASTMARPSQAAPQSDSPIMVLFKQWNMKRDEADAKAADGITPEAVVNRAMDECDHVMGMIMALQPTDARDFAAKLSCLTHYGAFGLDGDTWGYGSAFIREAAALVGHPEHVAPDHL